MTEIRALSLHEPWAALVAVGAKRIETRSWRTSYRGFLAVHAARRWTAEQRDICFTEPFWSALKEHTLPSEWMSDRHAPLPLGAIVAVVELVDCCPVEDRGLALSPRERDFGDFAPGRYAWVTSHLHRLARPIPLRGQQGLWTLESAVVDRIEQQTGPLEDEF